MTQTQTIDWQANRLKAYRWRNYLITAYLLDELDKVPGLKIVKESDPVIPRKRYIGAHVDRGPNPPGVHVVTYMEPLPDSTWTPDWDSLYFDLLRGVAYDMAIHRDAPPEPMEDRPAGPGSPFYRWFHPPAQGVAQ